MRSRASARDSAETSTEVNCASGLPARERDRLGADPAASLEHAAAGGVGGVVVQQVDERAGLVVQALVRAGVVAVDVVGQAMPRRVWNSPGSAWCRHSSSATSSGSWSPPGAIDPPIAVWATWTPVSASASWSMRA